GDESKRRVKPGARRLAGGVGDRVLHIKAQKERSSQNRESKANNTGGDGAKLLNVCLTACTSKDKCEDIAAR
ncbi:MAG: hypothetical protein J6I46_15065, partial [Ruminococcus sp.]|nr:hypothetical protein [Ruminococcus sp.]